MAQGELAKRVAVAGVGIPFAIVVVYLGGWALAALLALVAVGGTLELYRLASQSGVAAFARPGAAAAAAYVLIAAAYPSAHEAAPYFWLLTFALMLAFAAGSIWGRGVEGQPLFAVAITVFGALLAGATLSYAVFLRALPTQVDTLTSHAAGFVAARHGAFIGTAFVFYPLVLTWINDSCAYFAGRAWGKRKLIPSVSPGKTVVGSVAGVIGTLLVGAAFAKVVFQHWCGLPVHMWQGALGGLIIAVVAQVGDLVESLFKREAGVKDSGTLLPGHGGILDRFDALYFSIPTAYWYLACVLDLGSIAWR
jgi:phosphatidate cytidylyltransferase